MRTWYWNHHGLVEGIKEFVVSFLKTAAAALLALLLLKLNDIHIDPSTNYAEYLLIGVTLIRALISGALKWLNTSGLPDQAIG